MFAESTVEFATNNSSGSTIPYATWKGVLEDVRVVVPPHPLLDRFQELAESLVKAGYGFLKENETLSRLRDELLPRLISGELQIPDGMLAA
jgi:type I restriction enzyme S subunit